MQSLGRGAASLLILILLPLVSFTTACSRAPEKTSADTSTPALLPEEKFKACLDLYAGEYMSDSPFATHPKAVRRQTLALGRDFHCTLTTQFPGSRHPATVETGTWRCDRQHLEVLLTGGNKAPERNEIQFELRQGWLVSTDFDRGRYGAEGLRLRRGGNHP